MGGLFTEQFNPLYQQPDIPPQSARSLSGKGIDPTAIPPDPLRGYISPSYAQQFTQSLQGPTLMPAQRPPAPQPGYAQQALAGAQQGMEVGIPGSTQAVGDILKSPTAQTVQAVMNAPVAAIDPSLRAGAEQALGKKYGGPVATGLETVLPMMMGPVGEAGEAATAARATEELGGVVATGELPRAGVPDYTGMGRGPAQIQQIPTAGLVGETGSIMTPEATMLGHGPTAALEPATQPLAEVAAQEPRFHGTLDPMTQIGPALEHSTYKSMTGPGLYTTNNYAVSQGYAGGAFPEQWGGKIYRVFENRPDIRLLHADERFPADAWDYLTRGNDPTSKAWRQLRHDVGPNYSSGSLIGNEPLLTDYFSPRTSFGGPPRRMAFEDYQAANAQNVQRAQRQMIEALQAHGYDGFQDIGGRRLGGPLHDVKIYWNPERDVTLREIAPQGGKLAGTPPLNLAMTPEAQNVLKGQASLREMTTAAQEQRAPDLTKLSGEHLRGYLQSLGLVQGGEPISEEQMKAFQRIFAKYD